MRTDAAIKQQQRKLFIEELISFSIIFSVLGLIIYLLFQNAIYENIDNSISIQERQIKTNTVPTPLIVDPATQANSNDQTRETTTDRASSPFRTETLIFSSSGTIENKAAIGSRIYQLLQQVKLNKRAKDQLATVTIKTSDNTSSSFRTKLIYVKKTNKNSEYAGKYVMILANIDSEIIAIKSFQGIFLITLIIFALLAVVVSYFLSRRSIQPIIKSWNRQQEFSADAAHELRTPLTVIQNNFEYLLTKPKSRIIDESETISIGLEETARMRKLTENLLQIARSDSALVQVNKEQTNVKAFFTHFISPYKEIADSQNKSLLQNILFAGDATFDQTLLKQVTTILLDNALKYTKSGATITVAVTKNSNNLELLISDTGIGIPDAAKSKVFDRFYRFDDSRTRSTGGNGLGLAIAKLIVEQQNGTITVHDNDPVGTKFLVHIPLSK